MLTVYSASAGSGKTYNLVLDYLAACFRSHLGSFLKLQNRRLYTCASCAGYQHILAITFTNNAAAEMKDRVVKQLNVLAFAKTADDIKQNDLENLCKKIFGDRDDLSREECFIFIHETSKALLHSILYDYARFSITTIDCFIQRIIRSSALYLNLSMNYAIQIRLTEFFRMAIEQYICELPKDNQQFGFVVKELLWQLEDKGYANINMFLSKGLDIIYGDAEKSHPHLQNFHDVDELIKTIEEWKKNKNAVLETCKKEIKPLAEQAVQILKDAETDNFRPNQKYNWDQWFANVTNDPFNLSKGFDSSRYLKEMDESKVLTPLKNVKNPNKEKKLEYGLRVKSLFEQIRDIVLKNAKTFFTFHILTKNANLLLVLKALQYHTETIKEQTNSFFLSESNPLLYDEIQRNNGETLFEKMGQYQQFFIDEFQDTSLMQWEDLKPLIINAMSSTGNLTLFGDVKQSIYRFRNGEAELFFHLSDFDRLKKSKDTDIAALLRDRDDFQYKPLKTNYRSQSSVIEFNNRFFQFYSKSLNQEDYYADVEQQTRPDKEGGLVQIFQSEKDNPKDIQKVWPECGDAFYKDVYSNLPAGAADLLYAVKDAKKRGYAYGDIAVLLSGRSKCNDFAQYLMLADIPVVTSESLQLCDNPNINVIISTLRIITNPSDSLSQTVLLQFLAQKHGQDFHEILSKSDGKNFNSLLKEYFDIQDFTENMVLWRTNPFLISVKEIIRFYDFSRNADPFVADFIDLILQYTQTQVASTANFLVWWDELNQHSETIPRLSLEGASDAVRLMTIHASKGLEYPVVITQCTAANPHAAYYWVTDGNTGQSCYVKHEKDMEYSDFQQEYEEENTKKELDALNLWYVDFTRARDMLYILTDFPAEAKPDEKKRTKKDTETKEKKDIKTIIYKFVTDVEKPLEKTENSIYYSGFFDWKNPNADKERSFSKSSLSVTCSELFLCGNPKVKVMQSETDTASMDAGTHIHGFLQKLTLFPTTQEEAAAIVAGEPDEIRERLLQLFERTATDATLRPYFYLDEGDRVLNEAPIITETGEEKRPDRIVFKPDHVMIIDYKTGREYKAKYETKLAEYKNYISQMGYQDVRTKILYID